MGRPDVQYGGVTLLASPEGGRYPSGNSLVISGTDRTVLIDPSIEVHRLTPRSWRAGERSAASARAAA